MRSRLNLLILLALAIAVLLAANLAIQLQPQEPVRWEYMVQAPMDILLEEDLAKLGLQGWEISLLVSVLESGDTGLCAAIRANLREFARLQRREVEIGELLRQREAQAKALHLDITSHVENAASGLVRENAALAQRVAELEAENKRIRGDADLQRHRASKKKSK